MDLQNYSFHRMFGHRIIIMNSGENVFRPTKCCEVIVHNLHYRVEERELFNIFSSVGEIYQLKLMMETNWRNRGYGYITFTDRDACYDAIRNLNNVLVRGRRITVNQAFNNKRLCLTRLPPNKSEQEIKTALKIVNIQGMTNVFKIQRPDSMIVEFDEHAKAGIALNRLQKGEVLLWNKPIHVDWDYYSNENAIKWGQIRRSRRYGHSYGGYKNPFSYFSFMDEDEIDFIDVDYMDNYSYDYRRYYY